MLTADEPVVLHASNRVEALAAAQMLWAVGVLELAGYVVRPHATETLATVDTAELKELLDRADVQVVDVREAVERDSGYLPGSTNIPYRLLRKIAGGALQRDRPVVTVCESGPRAAIAASLLATRGLRRARGHRRRNRRLHRRRGLVQALRRVARSSSSCRTNRVARTPR